MDAGNCSQALITPVDYDSCAGYGLILSLKHWDLKQELLILVDSILAERRQADIPSPLLVVLVSPVLLTQLIIFVSFNEQFFLTYSHTRIH